MRDAHCNQEKNGDHCVNEVGTAEKITGVLKKGENNKREATRYNQKAQLQAERQELLKKYERYSSKIRRKNRKRPGLRAGKKEEMSGVSARLCSLWFCGGTGVISLESWGHGIRRGGVKPR